eukprot:COSAG05_NODE_19184_length_296_cov_1.050761_1_plen_68_part_10
MPAGETQSWLVNDAAGAVALDRILVSWSARGALAGWLTRLSHTVPRYPPPSSDGGGRGAPAAPEDHGA